MARKVDWPKARAEVSRRLEENETLRGIAPAIAVEPDWGSGGLIPTELIPFLMAGQRLAARRKARLDRKVPMLPTAPRMLLGVTDRRLLVWSARRDWQPDRFLGTVGMGDIVAAEAPTVGGGWRSVVIHFSAEPMVTIKVPSAMAVDLARALEKG